MLRARQKGFVTVKQKLTIQIVVAFFVGVVCVFTAAGTVNYTNTTEFCTSCHSQQIPLAEYQESLHYENVSGVRAGCADCHVPDATLPKLLAKVMAAKDVYHELMGTIDTPEKYEARRWHMANIVWKKMEATDSRECRSCHVEVAMDLSGQDSTARKKHKRARRDGETCIACHTGVAHKEPRKPRVGEAG